jgi:hypothetical protein
MMIETYFYICSSISTNVEYKSERVKLWFAVLFGYCKNHDVIIWGTSLYLSFRILKLERF